MEYYGLIKSVHITTAILTFFGFSLRGYWMLAGDARLNAKASKILPHINDTLLLASAVTLSILSGQYPGVVGWISLKLVLLVAYIVSGTIALKRGKTPAIRQLALVISLGLILTIFAVAAIKPALG